MGVVLSGVVLMWLSVAAALDAGDAAPAAVDVVTLAGRRQAIDMASPGQVTVIDFFATWCPHCRESSAAYDQVIAGLGDRVRILVVDVEEQPATVRRFFAARRPPDGVTVVL